MSFGVSSNKASIYSNKAMTLAGITSKQATTNLNNCFIKGPPPNVPPNILKPPKTPPLPSANALSNLKPPTCSSTSAGKV